MDIFFVNKIPFFHTKTENINFRTVQQINSRKMRDIIAGINFVKNKYEKSDFKISQWHGDNEFDVIEMKNALLPATLEPYARGEHVGFIERSIREIKERARATCAGLPFKRYPKIMVVELMNGIVHMLDTFTTTNNIGTNLSPGMIVEGRNKYNMAMNKIKFGSYALVHLGTTNT